MSDDLVFSPANKWESIGKSGTKFVDDVGHQRRPGGQFISRWDNGNVKREFGSTGDSWRVKMMKMAGSRYATEPM